MEQTRKMKKLRWRESEHPKQDTDQTDSGESEPGMEALQPVCFEYPHVDTSGLRGECPPLQTKKRKMRTFCPCERLFD